MATEKYETKLGLTLRRRSPAMEYRRCRSSLARENFGDFPGFRKTRVINFVVLPALGAVGESSPTIIRPQTTPAVMKKSKLSQTTVCRRARSSGEELPERPPAKQQRYPGGQFSDGVPSSVLPRRLFAYGDGCDGHFDGFPVSGAVSASRCTLPELYEAHRLPPQPTARYGSQTRVLVHLRARSTTVLRMLGNEYLAVDKQLPLALIALVDGVLCPSNKDLKLTPRYVEMMSDFESFLAYPWGRESFLTIVPRFLPPLVIAPGETHCK
ncbi:BnaC06g03060D [Brassica napus]|uniref:BnaC06g03060D protein n=1 Tax=Brassica napus TaxID=3708 RepID=A0A078GNL7_BRANA|nr:BnaC06g03060D [Brassica napus]